MVHTSRGQFEVFVKGKVIQSVLHISIQNLMNLETILLIFSLKQIRCY